MAFLTPKVVRTKVGRTVQNRQTTRQPIIPQHGNGYNASLQPVALVRAIRNPYQRQRG